MSWSNLAAYKARIVAPDDVVDFGSKTITATATAGDALASCWTVGNVPAAGAAPTTSVVPDNTTLGALGQRDGGSATRRLVRWLTQKNIFDAPLWLYDRLVHSGGLSGTVTSAQTTNLPTAALTRYTSGVGVHMALEIYTTVGATPTTVTCSYTNSAGTPGRTSVAVVFGGSTANAARSLIRMPLQQGDVGVRSVESVTVLASTGTAGNFGVTLYKPLLPLVTPINPALVTDTAMNFGMNLPEIVDGACLFLAVRGAVTTAHAMGGSLIFMDDDT